MKQTVIRMLITAFLFALAGSTGFAQDKPPAPPADTTQADTTMSNKSEEATKEKKEEKKKETYIAEKVKDMTVYKGLFTLYQNAKDGTTYIEVQKAQLGKEFIYFQMYKDGVVGAGGFRGAYGPDKIFTLRKVFDKIELVEQNTSYYFDPENALSRASSANISPAILSSLKIEANDSLETAYLLKAEGLFLSEDLESIKPAYPPTWKGYKLGRLSKDKSKFLDIRSYPQNTDVVVEYVYEDDSPQKSPGAGATDARLVNFQIQHSFIALPKNDYQPRYDDPRVGYFLSYVTDLTSIGPTPYRDMITRWHLKKKNPGAALSEPVTPIVWWIENTTPVEIRQDIKEGVLAWNIAFEKAGFKNAIQVKIQPDDAEWDAGDIRYNVLRWTSSPNPPFAGYGPSFVNPRTGQILGADIMLEMVHFKRYLNRADIFSTALLENTSDSMPLKKDYEYCSLGLEMQHANMLGSFVLSALGPSYGDHKEMVKQSIYHLILHEVGHTLGLNHNMQGSQLRNIQESRNKSLTEEKGLTGSVMDYPAMNLAAVGTKQGQYFETRPGPYDIWAIQFGYDPDLANEKKMKAHLARSTEPALAFGNDADDMRSAGRGLDPRINIRDFSNEAIQYSIDRIVLTQHAAKSMKDKIIKNDQSYQELRDAYMILTSEHSRALSTISRYIGGVYVDRAFKGQPGATQPFTPVSRADQKRAMASLSTYAFAPNAFDLPSDLYTYLQTQRRGFNLRSAPEDPKIHARVLTIQKGILAHLLHPNVMQRMTDTQLYGNEYPLAEMMDDLTAAIFKDDQFTPVNGFRKGLQVEYVNRLLAIMGEEGRSSYDHVSKGLAYYHLKNIHDMAKNADSADSGTQAHRAYVAALIEAQLKEM